MIGTHDSVTGEQGTGFLSWLVTPFARTQRKTLKEQYEAGTRYFDIRIKKYKGKWHGGHGLWTSKKSIYEIVNELNDLGRKWRNKAFELGQQHVIEENDHTNDLYCDITLEGTDKDIDEFLVLVDELSKWNMRHLHIRCACVKLPKWRVVRTFQTSTNHLAVHHCFKTLDWSSWHTLIPIPWLWNKVYKIEPIDGAINSYDFL